MEVALRYTLVTLFTLLTLLILVKNGPKTKRNKYYGSEEGTTAAENNLPGNILCYLLEHYQNEPTSKKTLQQ